MERLEKILSSIMYDNKQKMKTSETYYHQNIKGVRHEQEFRNITPTPEDVLNTRYPSRIYSQDEIQKIITNETKLIENGFGKIEPVSYIEACKRRQFLEEYDVKFTLIPEVLYNKMFVVGDYEVHIQYEDVCECPDKKRDEFLKNHKEYPDRYKNESLYADYKTEWNVILKHHGYQTRIATIRLRDFVEFRFVMKEYYSNWYWLKDLFTSDKNCILEKEIKTIDYEYYELIEEFFKIINISEIQLQDSDIPFQDRYDFNQKDRNTKSVKELSEEQTDFKWFIQSQTKNGVYSPTRAVIDRIYPDYYDWSKPKYGKNLDKKLLHKLDVHTVQMKDTVHFNIRKFFNINDIIIKAPKKVIERYGYEKNCANQEILKKIEAEKKAQEIRNKLFEYNDTFTLSFHGKVVLKSVRSEEIISYLQNKSTADMENEAIETVKPIFDAFPSIDSIELATFGTHYMYELAGEKHFDTDCNNTHIDRKIWEQIDELYSDNLYAPDENVLEIRYGWSERGAQAFGVKRTKDGNLEIYVEDSNACEI